MQTLILEALDYSGKALETYKKMGPVWLGDIPEDERDNISLLVIRLGHYVDDRFLDLFPNLLAIATPTTGLTHIDVAACEARKVRIFSLQECRRSIEAITSTSELTIGLIISLLRKIPKAHLSVCVDKEWKRDDYRSRQLTHLTLGIVGLGRIGAHVASYARAFGMSVIACDPYQPKVRFQELEVRERKLIPLLKEADIISIHANLREDNRHLIGPKEISKMREGSLLINTARGALIDEDAVVTALSRGHLGGVAVDVLTNEHGSEPWESSPLIKAAEAGLNVIITPHIGGCTKDAMHITENLLAECVFKSGFHI